MTRNAGFPLRYRDQAELVSSSIEKLREFGGFEKMALGQIEREGTLKLLA